MKKNIVVALSSIGALLSLDALAENQNCCITTENCCGPVDNCCENFYYVGGDYLYMRVWQEGLDRAGKGPLFTGEIEAVDFDWSNGFRVTAGAEFCCDWGLSGTYTYLRPSGSKTIKAQEIFPTILPQYVAGGVDFTGGPVFFDLGEIVLSEINSDVKLNYNLVDIELAKVFNCSSCFSFQVSTGVQIGLLDEATADYHTGVLLISVDEVGNEKVTGEIPVEIDWEQSWDFDGAGLRVGASGKYQVGCGFFVMSDFHTAVLFGKYKNRNNRTIPVLDGDAATGLIAQEFPFFEATVNEYYLLTMKENYHDFVTNIQLSLGLGWEYWCECVGFKLSAAYEMFYWWDLAVFRQGLTGKSAISSTVPLEAQFLFAGTSSSSKLSRQVGLHGLVVSLDIIY